MSSNLMEVISKGRFEMVEERAPSSASDGPSERQLSLEYLPPEEPQFSGSSLHSEDPQEASSSSLHAADLYSSVEMLSKRLQNELCRLKDARTLEDGRGSHSSLELVDQLQGSVSPPSEDLDSSDEISSRTSNETVVLALLSHETQSPNSPHYLTTSTTHTSNASPSHGDSDEGVSSDNHPSSTDHKAEAFSSPSSSSSDPKLQKAYEKMRKLDEKLSKVSRREWEVKHQRRLLEQQMLGGDKDSLELVPLESAEDDTLTASSPVFRTQVEDTTSTVMAGGTQSVAAAAADEAAHCGEEQSEEEVTTARDAGGVNFIKRNIELAGEAGALVAMTEAEKRRLEDLLDDEQELEQPYAATLGLPAGGFALSKADTQRMEDIDSRLQALMPPEHWEPGCLSSGSSTPPPATANCCEDAQSVELSMSGPGEDILRQYHFAREEIQRLREIEGRLASIQGTDVQDPHSPSITAIQLQTLLDQCCSSEQVASRTMTSPTQTMPVIDLV